jgi:hypothetical protein
MAAPSKASGGRFPEKWSPSKRMILEWRGLPEDTRPDRAISIADVLGTLLPKLGLDTRIKEADIMAAWKGIVGDFIAQHSKPERLVAGTLMIRVIQPSVRYELDRTWKPQIIERLREQFGEKMIRDIKFIL